MFGMPTFLLTDKQKQRLIEAEKQAKKERIERGKKNAVPWEPMTMAVPKKVWPSLAIDGDTYYIVHSLFDVKPTKEKLTTKPGEVVSRGIYSYYHRILPAGETLSVPLYPERDSQPSVYFTKPVVIPVLVEAPGRVWMSMTPAEIFSQRGGIKFCRDEVLVGGLGLGWFLTEVAKRSQVKKITLVEKNPLLLEWYGNDLCKKLGVDVICDDVYNVIPKMPKTTRMALDIWPGWFDARYDRQLRQARRDGYNIWAWGSARGER